MEKCRKYSFELSDSNAERVVEAISMEAAKVEVNMLFGETNVKQDSFKLLPLSDVELMSDIELKEGLVFEMDKKHGSFITHLCKAAIHSDSENFKILRPAIEEIVNKYKMTLKL